MSTDWTAERLDALPEHVVIEYRRDGLASIANRRDEYGWIDDEGAWMVSEDILDLADPGSIRVVSVPIDALLSDEAVLAARDDLRHTYRTAARSAIRAAIARVTGDQS